MTNKDIIEMYKRGYSVKTIIKKYYNYKNRDVPKNHYFDGTFIIPKKEYSYSYCANFVYDLLIDFIASNNEVVFSKGT